MVVTFGYEEWRHENVSVCRFWVIFTTTSFVPQITCLLCGRGTIMGSAFQQPITDSPRRGLQLCSSLQRAFCAPFRRSDPSVKKLENRHKSSVTDATWGLAQIGSRKLIPIVLTLPVINQHYMWRVDKFSTDFHNNKNRSGTNFKNKKLATHFTEKVKCCFNPDTFHLQQCHLSEARPRLLLQHQLWLQRPRPCCRPQPRRPCRPQPH